MKILIIILTLTISIFSQNIFPIGKTTFQYENGKTINLSEQNFIVIYIDNHSGIGTFYMVDKDGTTWKIGRITGGAAGYKTNYGSFSIYHKAAKHMSSKYPDPSGINNMNYSMFFNGGIALHQGSVTHLSHGCVHVHRKDVTTMFRWSKHGTRVIVTPSDYKSFAIDDINKIYGTQRHSKVR